MRPELWDFTGVNGFSAAQTSPERVTKALFSESVEAKLWLVASRALRSVSITSKAVKKPDLTYI